MTARSILITGVLSLTAIGIASAKSYSVSLTATTKVGSTELKSGDYRVKVAGDQAVFTNEGGKSFSVPVKIEQSATKFDSTSVDATDKNGTRIITEIDLAGSGTRLEFAQ